MIPEKINILGLDYKVKQVDEVSNSDYMMGLIDVEKQKILLCKGMTEQHKKQVLVHEAIHGTLNQLGYLKESDDEALVNSLSCSLCHIFAQIDNTKKV